jgi:murein hydrolase activator
LPWNEIKTICAIFALFLSVNIFPEEQMEDKLKRLAMQVTEIAQKEEGTKDRISLLKKRTMLSELTVAKLRKEKEKQLREIEKLKKDIELIEQQKNNVNEYFKARMRFQYLLGFLSEYRLLSSAASTEDLRQASFYINLLTARDKKNLDGLEMLRREEKNKEAQCNMKLSEIETIESDSAAEKTKLFEEIKQTNELLSRLSQNSDAARKALEENLEDARRMETYFKDLNFKNKVEMYGKNIILYKGKLPGPLKGKVALGFGDYLHPKYKTRLPHPGVDFEAPLGTPVCSIFEGEVVYADWLSGYGYTVILAHPGGFFSLASHLDRIEVKLGQVVSGGQKVGSSGGDPTKDYSGIYFELRQGKSAVDPLNWIKEW